LNAYILVYEKVEKAPIELIYERPEDFAELDVLSVSEKDNKYQVQLEYYGIKPYIPE